MLLRGIMILEKHLNYGLQFKASKRMELQRFSDVDYACYLTGERSINGYEVLLLGILGSKK